ncbi:REP-associated tyrosine transposase [Saccharospirillum salsuginis]|uniref:Transposase n=1 Tax=Saccharospirillum salsuginis TaxID=418750 RepID=A0A918N8K3_9GAMM|nr:transposase [Saccharospirillum salsuginis]GGX47353.1 transposase [Saccharospirillum salsuginis]
MRYRRNFVAGGRYFFTVVTHNRQPLLTTDDSINTLRNALRHVRHKYPFELDAMVVLPDHLHCIWSLPIDDADFARRWRLIKTWFSKHSEVGKASQSSVWQRRYWEHTLRDDEDVARHVDYIHYNPVKHGYVARAGDWPYSSFRKFVRLGVYSEEWAVEPGRLEGVGWE